MAPTGLLDLPNELLLQLPLHMHNIEDFKNTSSACQRLRNVYTDTLPKTILRLASQSAPTFFSPHPHFLVLAVARQIANWATASEPDREARAQQLVEAFRSGVKGLLTLALRDDVEGVGLTMDDVRRMHEVRFSTINPLDATIDAMIGTAWYQQPDFWSGGAEDAFTLYADVSSATFQLLIYGELFGDTLASFMQPSTGRKRGLDVGTRIEFVKYCIPDWSCQPSSGRHDGFKVLPVGPYAEGAEDSPDAGKLEGNQTALAHLVGGAMFEGTLWKRAWRRVLIAAGVEENEDGKWPEGWVRRLQRIGFKKDRKTANSGGEDVAGGADEARDGETVTTASGEEPRDEQLEQEQEEEEADDDDDENEDEDDNEDEVEDEDEAESEEEEADWLYDSSPETESNITSHPEDWRFYLFYNALTQAGGLQTMEMVAQFKGREENRSAAMKPEWKAHILRLRDQVLALKDEDEPGFEKFGKRRKLKVSEAPDLGAELYWCCAGLWSGL